MLAAKDEAMIVERFIFAGKRGFTAGKDALKSVLMQIASDGRPSWKNRAPTDDIIRAFRARQREKGGD